MLLRLILLLSVLQAALTCGQLHAQDNFGGQTQPWIATMRPDSLEGDPVIVTGAVFIDEPGNPAKFATVVVYHTRPDGYYRGSGDKMDYENADFTDTLITNDKGHYIVETYIPGYYNHRERAVHMHFIITTKGGEPHEFELYFRGDPKLPKWREQAIKERYRDLPPVFSALRPVNRDKVGDARVKRDFLIQTQN